MVHCIQEKLMLGQTASGECPSRPVVASTRQLAQEGHSDESAVPQDAGTDKMGGPA